ncbi:MAG: hypothetical protein H8E24_05565, partial [Verrucomicrobia bacterium]|nr:hypothetical protein [Verrucomicrobiota bacterium]
MIAQAVGTPSSYGNESIESLESRLSRLGARARALGVSSQAYSAEVRGAAEGVPQSLCDAATQLVEAETALQEPGPADALQGSDAEGEDASLAEHSKRLAADQSLAIMDDGS